jgi:DegV family protein with EDD domain
VSIRVVTDSACDLPDELVRELGIVVVPLAIRFGDDEFVDRVDLTSTEFWNKCNASPQLPSTAAPAPGQFEAAYRTLIADGATGIVAICLSGALSATHQSAVMGAAGISDVPIEVIDSRSVSMGLGLMVVDAARAARDGAELSAIVATTHRHVASTHVVAVLDTLDNLKKGGRIGGAKALVASVLSIKPVIRVVDGVVAEGGRQRTRTKALAFLIDEAKRIGSIEHLAVMHARCADIDQVVTQLRAVYDGEIIVGEIGAVIGAHSGPGAVGIVVQTN